MAATVSPILHSVPELHHTPLKGGAQGCSPWTCSGFFICILGKLLHQPQPTENRKSHARWLPRLAHENATLTGPVTMLWGSLSSPWRGPWGEDWRPLPQPQLSFRATANTNLPNELRPDTLHRAARSYFLPSSDHVTNSWAKWVLFQTIKSGSGCHVAIDNWYISFPLQQH